jgi:hypothetical protein
MWNASFPIPQTDPCDSRFSAGGVYREASMSGVATGRSVLRLTVLLLAFTATAARGELVWRIYCHYRGQTGPLELAFDTSRECHDWQRDVLLSAETACKAGDKEACDQEKKFRECFCQPEKVK